MFLLNYSSLVLLITCLTSTSAIINSSTLSPIDRSDNERALMDKLFKNYSKKQKPPGPVQIKFALNLNQIINVIEKDQIFLLNVFVDHEWFDPRITWDPAEFNNITVLRISSDLLWIPDTFVYTTAAQSGFLLAQPGAYFVVGNEGKIFWPNPLTEMRIRCSMGIAWFPYDDQLCTIIFGSWSYTLSYLNYTFMNEFSSLQGYSENNEWSLREYKPYRKEIKYENWIENDLFSEIHYKIVIQRKPLFVLQNFCIPAFMLCIITLCSFFMPFAQEMQIGISIILSFSVFKLRLSDDVPAQSDAIPLINIYFVGCMAFALSAMVWFFLMHCLREYQSQHSKVPRTIKFLVSKCICHIMCIKNYRRIKVISDVALPSNRKNCDLNLSRNEELVLLRLESDRLRREESHYENCPDIETEQWVDLADLEIIKILNRFGFYVFLTSIILLNLFCLIILPYFIKQPLKAD